MNNKFGWISITNIRFAFFNTEEPLRQNMDECFKELRRRFSGADAGRWPTGAAPGGCCGGHPPPPPPGEAESPSATNERDDGA